MENITSSGHNADSFEQKQLLANLEFAKFHLSQKLDAQKVTQNNRLKTLALVGGGIFCILVMLIGIIAWCLSIGKEQFIIDFLKYSLYPISAGGGFWAGRISSHRQHESNLNPTQL